MNPSQGVRKTEDKALVRLAIKRGFEEDEEVTDRDQSKRTCPFRIPTCPGCRNINDPPDEKQRMRHEIQFYKTMADIVGVRSPAVQFVQLRQAFVNSYFSMGVINSNRQYFNIFYWMAPQSPAMNASRDALCLVHLGSRCKHEIYSIYGSTALTSSLRS